MFEEMAQKIMLEEGKFFDKSRVQQINLRRNDLFLFPHQA